MTIQPITLEGHALRLEPLTHSHAPNLLNYATEELFVHFPGAPKLTLTGLTAYITRLNNYPNWLPFAIVLRESGKAIGITCYLDIRDDHCGLEIGSTWIHKEFHGTIVHPESKYLLLHHALEERSMVRVQMRTDLRNLRSQFSLERLGAEREGVMRADMILDNGYVRDAVLYSVTYRNWQEVKEKIEARLGYVPRAKMDSRQ